MRQQAVRIRQAAVGERVLGILDQRPLTLRGTKLAVGNYALAWWPNLDGKGMGFEIRRVDMREVNLRPMVLLAGGGVMTFEGKKAAANLPALRELTAEDFVKVHRFSAVGGDIGGRAKQVETEYLHLEGRGAFSHRGADASVADDPEGFPVKFDTFQFFF